MANTPEKKTADDHHPLSDKWVLWHDAPKARAAPGQAMSKEAWNKSISRVISVDSVDGFWRLFNNLDALASLPIGSAYNLFKNGIRPEWEDPANEGGGRWYVSFETPTSSRGGVDRAEFDKRVDNTWMYAALSLLGNSVDKTGIVCGIVAAVRNRETRFDVWTRKAPPQEIRDLGAALLENLAYCARMSYRYHKDQRGRSSAAFYC
uniref:Translation initiation factor 4E n=1 Tax=Marseillevirus LCMAC103 TaxID=2506604 RepID=A0A481YVL9_9VIRU|nr:MAG: translation initiation factor 4E [Marseillevirus LCMAC103]